MGRPDPDRAGLPGHCCLCGRRDARCLCRACRVAWTIDGTLHPEVVALKRLADRETQRLRRARITFERLRRARITFERLGEDW